MLLEDIKESIGQAVQLVEVPLHCTQEDEHGLHFEFDKKYPSLQTIQLLPFVQYSQLELQCKQLGIELPT